jgi:hypothetical protein
MAHPSVSWLVALVTAGGCAVSAAPPSPPLDLSRAARDLSMPETSPGDLAQPGQDLAQGSGDLAGTCSVGRLVVNEVQTTGATGSKTDEWVEIFNTCTTGPVDMTGVKLIYRSSTATSDGFVLAMPSQMLAPLGYFLVADGGYSGTPDLQFAAGGLADTGGAVGLRDAAGNLIDSVGWGAASNSFVEGAAATAPGNGQSIARKPNGTDTNHNDKDFLVGAPTPKAAN